MANRLFRLISNIRFFFFSLMPTSIYLTATFHAVRLVAVLSR